MGHIRRRKALWPNSSMTKLPWLNTLRHTTEEHETDLLSKMENNHQHLLSSWIQWHIPAIPVLGSIKQEDWASLKPAQVPSKF